MKIKNEEEQVSAFSVYSEKFRQKKKKKSLDGGVAKSNKRAKQMKANEIEEIQNILMTLAKKSIQTDKKGSNDPQKLGSDKKLEKTENEKDVTVKKLPNKSDSKNVPDTSVVKKGKKRVKGVVVIKPNKLSKKNKIKIKEVDFEENAKENSEVHADSKIILPNNGSSHLEKVLLPKPKKGVKKLKVRASSPSVEVQNKVKKLVDDASNAFTNKQQIIEDKLNEDSNFVKKKSKNKLKQSKVDTSHIKEVITKKQKTLTESRKETAKNLFQWLVQPISQQDFMKNYWEKRPLLICRESDRSYYSDLLSTPAIDVMLRENLVYFTKHLDVTSYTNGVRETHNLSGRAQANVVWDFYANGCSVRLLSPQTFTPRLHAVNATLQEWFGCLVGANAYLTPAGSQGFAPHYDDIEAFVLQLEGAKRWKVYAPRSESDTLPRTSSRNFTEAEMTEKPLLDVTLEPGDLLYFPRGYIHQASTPPDRHSLHITLSAYQRTAWVDLFEQALPIALRRAAAAEPDLRRGLPLDYLNVEHGADDAKAAFAAEAARLMGVVAKYFDQSLGAAVDRMGAQFMHDALPPVLTAEEIRLSSRGGGLAMTEDGKLKDDKLPEFELDTQIRLISTNVCRLVEDDETGEARLHHCLDNQPEYHAEEPQFLVLPPEGVPAVARLCAACPRYLPIRELPFPDPDALLTLISDLWDAGLLLAKNNPQTTNQEGE